MSMTLLSRLFLSAVARMARSRTGPSEVPLERALLRRASAGEALERGARATGAPSAEMGVSKRRSCPSVGLVLLIAGAWWSARAGAGEELVVAAVASNKLPRGAIVVQLAPLFTVTQVLLVRGTQGRAGPTHLLPLRLRQVQSFARRGRDRASRRRSLSKDLTEGINTDSSLRGLAPLSGSRRQSSFDDLSDQRENVACGGQVGPVLTASRGRDLWAEILCVVREAR